MLFANLLLTCWTLQILKYIPQDRAKFTQITLFKSLHIYGSITCCLIKYQLLFVAFSDSCE